MKIMLRNGKEWYIAKITKANVDVLLADVKNSSMDIVFVISGGEGTGKSFIARGLAMYCATILNSPFGVQDIYFDADSYINHSLEVGHHFKSGYHKINVLDEGRHVLFKRSAISKSNKKFTNYLSECRSLGQVHIICCPAYHDLDRYIVQWRMNMLFHCKKNYVRDKNSETGVKMKRGEYKLYTNKRNLDYCYNKPGYEHPKGCEVHSIWSNKEVFSEVQLKEYEDKKNEMTVTKYSTLQTAAEVEQKAEENLREIRPEQLIKVSEAAKKIGMQAQTLIKWIKNDKVAGKKLGRCWFIDKKVFEMQ